MPSKGKGKKKKRKGSTPVSEMDFSAAESFLPALDIDFNVGPGTSGGGFFDEKLAELETLQQTVRAQSENRQKLKKLIDIKKGKTAYTNPLVASINENTTRTVTGLKTQIGEFVYNDDKAVSGDTSYHIHYTKDLSKYYMTEHQHSSSNSRLIFPVKIKDDFTIYNSLSKQKPMKIESATIAPTEDDYSRGFINRSFARKANEPNSAPFEINKNQIDSSPLYVYANLNFMIKGTRSRVKAFNNKKISIASRGMKNLKRYLNPFQFYRETGTEDVRERILEQLKVQRIDSVTTNGTSEQTTQTMSTTSPSTTTTQTQTGPPPGVMSGGAGGAGGGGGGGY